MRWICKDDIEELLDQDWLNSAHDALEKLKSEKDPFERKKILDKTSSSDIWRFFYSKLSKEFKKKCWYCESEEIRSDTPIDHFRPKKKVTEDDQHPGYWWLAYDWRNYRCACTYCNSTRVVDGTSGGKQNQFPLFNPSERAYDISDDLEKENPALLDPFDIDDCKLVWFDNDGKTIVNPSKQNPNNTKKVENSVSIYHLDQNKIVNKRKKIRIEISRSIKDLKQAKAVGSDKIVKSIKEKLAKMIRESEFLSLTAEVYLKNYKHLDEVKDILNIE